MRTDDENEESFFGAGALNDEDFADVRAELGQTQTIPAEPPAAVVAEEPPKICCICGLDVTHKKRCRDRSERYWCAHCHDFLPPTDKSPGMAQCPDCARDTRLALMVDKAGVRVCRACNLLYTAEAEPRRLHKSNVTANPELEIRRIIRRMVSGLVILAAAAGLLTLYHFRLLWVRPKPWVPFEGGLFGIAGFAVAALGVIGFQYFRMGVRKRAREIEYDKMVRSAVNHIMTLDDDSHTMGISEPPDPLRRRAQRALARVEACAGLGVPGAGAVIESLANRVDATPLIAFLLSQRPETADTVARNREIAMVSYLQGDLVTAGQAVTAILLRLAHDQEAMTRQALICFRGGELEQAKKIFRRVVHIAREKNSEIDLAAAYCNLGMLHVMLNEFDDASNRYNQAMTIYKRMGLEADQADCMVNLCLIAYRVKKAAELAQVEAEFRKALAMTKRCKRREGTAVCCSMLGVILFEKEEPQLKESESLLSKAIRLNLELGRAAGVATAYGNLGLVRVKRGDLTGGRELFIKAQGIYQRINRPKMAAKIQGMLKTVGTLSAARASRK
jgi:tetratricopeptide (TPR) repeat protein